ncbi:MAG: hypothetical protein IIA89_13710, partial [Chloroflexi bacterium]|nr:hypothetical protein [Chloroflexota bacterium]
MAHLRMALLGPPQIELDGEPLETGTRKAVAMLVYLALEGEVQRRSSLTVLLWPEAAPDRARSNFRRTLFALRSALGDDWLRADRSEVELQRSGDRWLDVQEFYSRLGSWREHDHQQEQLCSDCFTDLERAAELYRGDFLQGFTLPDSPEFDDWQSQETERQRYALIQALDRLIGGYAVRGEYGKAIAHSKRLLALDPLHEPGHRQLMRLHFWNGDRPAAVQHYHRCVEVLEQELGVPPMDQTERLLERIQSGDLEAPSAAVDSAEIAGTPTEAAQNPYKGLFAFAVEDAPFFFGRELFTNRLIEVVRRQPLIAVIGTSGSGKSSILRAGLVARMLQDPDWQVVVFRPGSRPFRSLAAALGPVLEDAPSHGNEAGRLAKALYSGEETLSGLLASRPGRKETRILLVADQFEELYTLCLDPERQRKFVDALLEPSQAPQNRPNVVVALTLRADFLGQALNYRPFADALQGADLKLGPMTEKELERAIKLPARRQGVAFEPGLVDRILADLAQEPGRLPLLQFALTAMWEQRDGPLLTHVGYRDIGGVSGALAHHAEQVYTSLDPEDQHLARSVLTQLVRPGEGTEDTRRLATREQLPERGWDVLQKLADARLVVTGRDPSGAETVEVVHEALIHGWDRLRGWIEADRGFRLWQERLRAALNQWEASEHDEGALLRGLPLATSERWFDERKGDLSEAEVDFINASIAGREGREEAERAQQERERALERAALRRLRVIAGVLGAAAI